MTRDTGWFKSSFSSGGQSCVEVRITEGAVRVRDTKHRDGGMLQMGAQAWGAFIDMSAHR
jgi:hypothetical protein